MTEVTIDYCQHGISTAYEWGAVDKTSVCLKLRVKEVGADHRSGGRMGSGEHVLKRNMGLEEARGICLDRGLWRTRVDGVPDR